MSADMQREFGSRDELVAYLRAEFPAAAAIDDHVSAVVGGRRAADALLEPLDPQLYARTRSYLAGAVTRLSPYLRYGVLSLAEMRDAAVRRVRRAQLAAKLVNELAWRDYFQRLYARIGDGIWRDQEFYKTGFAPADYAPELPADIAEGRTGLPCVDGFVAELRATGYLHNHARMWLAAYVVHWRRVAWQAGARWFLQHLLDGDPASNNMSWQWIASTFSHKPYMFNRENLERYSDAIYCFECPLYGHCVFEGSYAELEADLFPRRATEEGAPNGGQ